jgi:hypothetical protein
MMRTLHGFLVGTFASGMYAVWPLLDRPAALLIKIAVLYAMSAR